MSTGESLEIRNPANGELVGQSSLGTLEHLEAAVTAARQAFTVTRRQSLHERAEVLLRVVQELEARRAAFVDRIVSESGKPVTLAEAEVTRAIATFATAADEAKRIQGEVLSMDAFPTGHGHMGLARRFPMGVVYGLTPFNFPLNLVAHKVAPCLASGNTLIVKPAPKTPLTALLLAEVMEAAGVPQGQVNVVVCRNELAGHLVGDPRVAMTSFTGSPTVGWMLKERCQRQKIALELGGNAAAIVHEDADIEAAVRLIATGGFSYAGQSCISVQRVLIHQPIYNRFRDLFVDYVLRKVVVGDPRDRSTLVGPMIDQGSVDRVLSWVKSALAQGARVLTGGTANGPFLQPTVLEDVRSDMDVCAKEVFGPLVTLQPYSDFSNALALANDSEFGLQAGVFTQDIRRALQAFESLEVGGVMINNVPTFRVENMPYGGVKASGFGREGIRYAMEEMTELRSLIVKWE